jgi:hypothetical protein
MRHRASSLLASSGLSLRRKLPVLFLGLCQIAKTLIERLVIDFDRIPRPQTSMQSPVQIGAAPPSSYLVLFHPAGSSADPNLSPPRIREAARDPASAPQPGLRDRLLAIDHGWGAADGDGAGLARGNISFLSALSAGSIRISERKT